MASELYRKLTALLIQAGCEKRREGKGSHEIWWSPLTAATFVVVRNGVNRHTANRALVQAGLPKAF